MHQGGYFCLILCLLAAISACSDHSSVLNQKQVKQEISKIDGHPIVTLDAVEFYKSNTLGDLRDKLAATQGRAILRGMNDRIQTSSIQKGYSIAVKDLGQYQSSKTGTPAIGSTHLRITEDDGETEDFILTLRPYIQHPKQIAAKGKSGMSTLSAGNTYLALSPDRFYLEDDANGNELWPVTFPAVSLSDTTDKIMVTFNKDGLVSTSKDQEKGTTQSAGETQIVFVEATPVISPNYVVEPCPDCDGGGGGGGGGSSYFCSEVSGRGEDVGGSTSGTQTYLSVELIRLVDTGDGDQEAELQMFVKNDDDYEGDCFPRSYKYRFDHNGSFDSNGEQIVSGADGRDYKVPDVDMEDLNYSTFQVDIGDDEWRYRDYFPLIDLTNNPGPWRLSQIDDDNDYTDFSQRRNSDPQVSDVWTYDMGDGNWKLTETGFSSDSHQYGSSDDPILESGVRRITIPNAQKRSGENGDIDAEKFYGSRGSFRYRFSLQNL